MDGTILYRWVGARVTDLAITSDGTRMVTICHEKKIRIYHLIEKSETSIQEDFNVTSLSLSSDSTCALVNVSSQVIS